MIRLILKGGLGNQMFQYAAGYSLAKKYNHQLVLDTTFLDTNIPLAHFTKRNFELNLFGVSEPVEQFSHNEFINAYLGYMFRSLKLLASPNRIIEDNYLLNLLARLNPSIRGTKDKVLKDFEPSKEIFMEGFFHDINSFKAYENEIKTIFNTAKLYDPQYDAIERELKTRDSVSINIRRGDYDNKKNRDIYVRLEDSYYTAAIQRIKESVVNPHFFIFSYDFPEGLHQPFGLKESEYTLLGKEYVGQYFKTYLRLITLCKHNILSNSTFSFWGGYLNTNTNRIVIAPSRWEYAKDTFNYPDFWHIINV